MKKQKGLVLPKGSIKLTNEECKNILGGVKIEQNNTYSNNEKKK